MRAIPLLLAAALAAGADVAIHSGALKLFRPLPAAMPSPANPMTPARVALGRMLYYDARLSKDGDITCNTCHPLDKFGADGAPVSTGHRGQKGDRNSPTVYHAAGHFAQFWDGRARDVEEQAKGPILNPVEMAMPSEARVVEVLKSIPGYRDAFRRAFPGEKDPVTFDNLARAIGAFERGLVTPARWDRFLKGDSSALSCAEKAGFNKFVEAGCAACHSGPYVGGNAFQKLGMVKPWTHSPDTGRHRVTRNPRDKMVFKTPSLRNIAKTAPYFHDGSVADLAGAIRLMAVYQTGKELSAGEIASIASWLDALTGEIPAAYIQPPALPAGAPSKPLQ